MKEYEHKGVIVRVHGESSPERIEKAVVTLMREVMKNDKTIRPSGEGA